MKKEILIPIIIARLTVAFLAVSLMVFFSGGRASLISKKLKLGALLLTFTGMLNSGLGQSDYENTCYVTKKNLSPIFVGLDAGYIRNNHKNVNLQVHPALPGLNPENITGEGYYAGITYEYYFSEYDFEKREFKSNSHSISAKINFLKTPIHYSKQYPTYELPNYIVTVPAEYTADFDISYLSFEIQYNYMFYNGFRAFVGISFDLPMDKTSEELFKIKSNNPDAVFPTDEGYILRDDNKTLVINDDFIPDFTSFHISATVGISYVWDITGMLSLIPEISYNYGLTYITANSSWKTSSIVAGMTARFEL